ncbi:MAG: response regulator [Alishewanella agri]|nr:response regulator [Alishewanella agri]
MRVLHVEDDEDIRAVTEIALVQLSGFQVLSCESGQQALTQAQRFAPQLILLDVMMPQMDGLQTLAALRQLPGLAGVPVIFMTARLQEAEQQRYLSAGAIAVIEKPFDPLTLGTQLRELCQTKLADSRLSDV